VAGRRGIEPRRAAAARGGRQQEAVAHLGQQALAECRAPSLQHRRHARRRGLDVAFSEILELKPEHRSLLLRAAKAGARALSAGLVTADAAVSLLRPERLRPS